MAFDVEKQTWSGESLWVLRGPNESKAAILPSVGANLIALSLSPSSGEAAVSVLSSPADAKELREAPTRYGSPVLFPFPSRIAGGRFTYGGRELQLDVYPDGNARHGFVTAAPFELEAQGADSNQAWVTFRFDGNTPDIQRQFPFPFEIRMTFRLDAVGLTVEVEGKNTGTERMPMGFGWHPYFNLPLSADSSRDACRLQVPANKYWELSPAPDLVPTGRRLPVSGKMDLRAGLVIGDNFYDDMFTDVERDSDGWTFASLIDERAKLKLNIGGGPTFREWVIYTPPERAAICLEPYTCSGNAFNLQANGIDAGVQDVEPGQSWSDAMRITLERLD
ncbi:MAG: aldose 1-epimerase [Firmicutes bacterium]|nr:aldose 1-epimerase [Bacillota bacterium]